jgi:ABC-type transport system involved in multi-copper enzyme maturation permease subunit
MWTLYTNTSLVKDRAMDNRSRLKQAWTIAKIEFRRAFFSKRAFWVYGLALFPCIIFLGHNVVISLRRERLSTVDRVQPAMLDTIKKGESADAILQRLGRPPIDSQRPIFMRRRELGATATFRIEPNVEAQFVRLSISFPTIAAMPITARIYELEVYGADDSVNLALKHPASGSPPCTSEEGPEKAVNGSINGGKTDSWCTHEQSGFLQVDLGAPHKLSRIVIKGDRSELSRAYFNIQAGKDNKSFPIIVDAPGWRSLGEMTMRRQISYFDGSREATLNFEDGKLVNYTIDPLLNFEEDRRIFAGIFQAFYLRLFIFFGCLGIFMNLFRGEMLDRTLHFWFLVPARRDVLLAGKYAAGLVASVVIFVGGALLSFAVMLHTHSPAEVEAYWQTSGAMHAFWYAAVAALGCIGYGSVFLATGLLLKNPIIPAAVLLGWESINGFLPAILQKLSILYYLQSMCPIPAPKDETLPALLQLFLAPATPASRTWSIVGLLVLTALVLWIARFAVRRMQISYGADV